MNCVENSNENSISTYTYFYSIGITKAITSLRRILLAWTFLINFHIWKLLYLAITFPICSYLKLKVMTFDGYLSMLPFLETEIKIRWIYFCMKYLDMLLLKLIAERDKGLHFLKWDDVTT